MKWVKVGELEIGKAMEGRLEEAPYAMLGVCERLKSKNTGI